MMTWLRVNALACMAAAFAFSFTSQTPAQAQTDTNAKQRTYNDAQMALLVIAGHSRCNWPLSQANLAKADALVKAHRPYTNQVDYDLMIAFQGGTNSVQQNEFCFGPKWRGIFDNAAKQLAATPMPSATPVKNTAPATAKPPPLDPSVPARWAKSLNETAEVMKLAGFAAPVGAQRALFVQGFVTGISPANLDDNLVGYFKALEDCAAVVKMYESSGDEFDRGAGTKAILEKYRASLLPTIAAKDNRIELTVAVQLENWDPAKQGFALKTFDSHVSVGHKWDVDSSAAKLDFDRPGPAITLDSAQTFIACQRDKDNAVIHKAFADGDTQYLGKQGGIDYRKLFVRQGVPVGYVLSIPDLFLPAPEPDARRIVANTPDRLVIVHLFLSPTSDLGFDRNANPRRMSQVPAGYYRTAKVVEVTASDKSGGMLNIQATARSGLSTGRPGTISCGVVNGKFSCTRQ